MVLLKVNDVSKKVNARVFEHESFHKVEY